MLVIVSTFIWPLLKITSIVASVASVKKLFDRLPVKFYWHDSALSGLFDLIVIVEQLL